MEEITAPGPEGITLDVVDDYWTYARTSIETVWVIEFFLKELKPVDIADIEPEDCSCTICTEKFTTDSHHPVRLPCNHIFGRPCIEHWLRPYATLRVTVEQPSQLRAMSLGANTCPQCRREFFPPQRAIDSLSNIEKRIKFWDMAYEHVGIALSRNDRRARESLVRYLRTYSARGLDEYYSYSYSGMPWQPSLGWHQQQLFAWCRRLKSQPLTPQQENLRQRLEDNATHDFPGGVRSWRNDQDELFYAVGPDNEERDETDANEEVIETEQEDDDTVEM